MARVILAVCCVPATAWAAPAFPLPPLAPQEHGEYVARDARTGEDLWRTQWTIDRASRDGQTTIRVQEDGKGLREGSLPTQWAIRMELDASSKDTRFSARRETRDLSGHLLEVRQRVLDYATGSGRVVTTDARTGKTESKSFSLPPDAIDVEVLATELRVLPELPDREMRFELVRLDGSMIEMLAKIVGRERVTVPAGSFECYKIELEPTGLLGVLAHVFLAKMYMWLRVAPPHIWIKYQGAEGGPGSRETIRELVQFSPPPPSPAASAR